MTVLVGIACLAAGYIAGMIHAAIITKGGQG